MRLEEKSETARRIIAARVLRGWDQRELNERLEKAQVGSDMASRLENDRTGFPKPRRDAVAGVLGVPVEWFTAPLESLVAVEDGRLSRIETALQQIANPNNQEAP